MSGPRKVGVLVALLLLTGQADAETFYPCTPSEPCHLRMRESTTLIKDNGLHYGLPPGRFFDEPTWELLDVELKRLQEQETRVVAENRSLRDSLSGWRPGWLLVTSTLFLGVGLGIGGYHWYQSR